MKIFKSLVIFISFLFCSVYAFCDEIYLIQLNNETINPVTSEYIVRSIEKAEKDNAGCLILELDTPGGLLESTRTIVKKMLISKIPIVVYIAPNGSRAGSAGVFITYASHIAAMAPSTNIGAAHPIELGKEGPKEDGDWKEFKKLLKDIKEEKEEQKTPPGDKLKRSKDQSAKSADNSAGSAVAKKKTATADNADKRTAEDADKIKQESEEDLGILENKILQDTTAFIRAIARERNRNVEWAIESVTKSSSITAQEALEKKVVELIARDREDLLNQLEGRTVTINDEEITLHTKDISVKEIDMTPRQKFFNVLANPNIAYILLILGFYGIFFELLHPGSAVPGVMGAIFLILAFYSMQTLPTNYAGLALLLLGLILLIAEAFVPGFGLLTLGGVVCTILGSMLLFDSVEPFLRVSPGLIIGFTLGSVIIAVFLLRFIFKAYKRKALGGKEGLIGEKGIAQSDLGMGREGKIYVHGELWNAESDEKIKKGEKVVVTEVDGLTVKVKKQ